MDLSYKNLTEAAAFAQLAEEQPVSLKEQFNSPAAPERIAAYQIPMAGGLTYSYAAMPVSDSILTALQALADEQQLIEKYRRLLDGDRINTGENRIAARCCGHCPGRRDLDADKMRRGSVIR